MLITCSKGSNSSSLCIFWCRQKHLLEPTWKLKAIVYSSQRECQPWENGKHVELFLTKLSVTCHAVTVTVYDLHHLIRLSCYHLLNVTCLFGSDTLWYCSVISKCESTHNKQNFYGLWNLSKPWFWIVSRFKRISLDFYLFCAFWSFLNLDPVTSYSWVSTSQTPVLSKQHSVYIAMCRYNPPPN